ncbi:hypothetical protein RYH80_18655 [Halobaculum sp. MBLA0147]|uniref:hypothetical protein n=1 Tax=Halobaculum sp. MBLA0147 TaxID=3079934 RepID=UPI003523E54F
MSVDPHPQSPSLLPVQVFADLPEVTPDNLPVPQDDETNPAAQETPTQAPARTSDRDQTVIDTTDTEGPASPPAPTESSTGPSQQRESVLKHEAEQHLPPSFNVSETLPTTTDGGGELEVDDATREPELAQPSGDTTTAMRPAEEPTQDAFQTSLNQLNNTFKRGGLEPGSIVFISGDDPAGDLLHRFVPEDGSMLYFSAGATEHQVTTRHSAIVDSLTSLSVHSVLEEADPVETISSIAEQTVTSESVIAISPLDLLDLSKQNIARLAQRLHRVAEATGSVVLMHELDDSGVAKKVLDGQASLTLRVIPHHDSQAPAELLIQGYGPQYAIQGDSITAFEIDEEAYRLTTNRDIANL